MPEPLDPALADAVLDGSPIDWPAAEARGATPSSLLADLRLVASVAQFQRVAHTHSPGDLLNRWGHLQLLERLGQGTHGEVYRAWDTRLDREVALKLISIERLLVADTADTHTLPSVRRDARAIIREGQLLAKVRHPNVVTIYGAEQIDDRIGFWMEFVRGETLEHIVVRDGPFRTADAQAIGVELCSAVAAVHAAGVLHRDIKAHNVMRADDGRIVLMDFGTGWTLGDDAVPDIAGTPLYLAPELFQQQPPTVRSDVYSLGVLLYRLVTASYPVRGESIVELRQKHESGVPTPVREANRAIGAGVARVIDGAIDPSLQRRPESAEALGASLQQLRRRARRKPFLYGAAVVAAAAAVGTAAWLMRKADRPPSRAAASIDGGPTAAVPAPAPSVPASSPAPPVSPQSTPPADRGAVAGNAETTSAPPVPARRSDIRPSIQILPMRNTSGRDADNWLSLPLVEMILREFRGSESFRWIPEAVPLAKAQLGTALQLPSSSLRPNIPADIIVDGEYTVSEHFGPPNNIRLTLELKDITSARPATTVTETGSTADLGDLVASLAVKARSVLGAAAPTVMQGLRIAASQPANADAARSYADGLSKPAAEWLESMEQAIAADPRFAPAHIALAESWLLRKDYAKARAASALAVELAAKLPFEERTLIAIRAALIGAQGLTGSPSEIASARAESIAKRDALFGQLFATYPDTLLYGRETVFAQDRAVNQTGALATIDALSRVPGYSDDVGLLRAEGRVASLVKDYARARRALDRAGALAKGMDDRRLLNEVRLQQAGVAMNLGETARAIAIAEAAQQDGIGAGRVNGLLSQAYRSIGDTARSRAAYEQQIESAKKSGSRPLELSLRWTVATMLADHGELAEARAMLEQLIVTDSDRAALDYARGPDRVPLTLAGVLTRQGQFADARRVTETLFTTIGQRAEFWEHLRHRRLARLAFHQGDLVTARAHASRAVEVLRKLPYAMDEDIAFPLAELGRVLLAAGETAAASEAIDEAVRTARTEGPERLDAFETAMVQAQVALEKGRPAEAQSAARRAMSLARGDGRLDDAAMAEAVLAHALLRAGNLAEARRSTDRVETRLKTTQDRLLALSGGIIVARVTAASNTASAVSAAKARLATVINEATHLGAVPIAFDARLALGELETKSGEVAAGRARLLQLERDATAAGFLAVARHAPAAAARRSLTNLRR